MTIKFVCNYCDKDVTEDEEYYTIKIECNRKDRYIYLTLPSAHACYDCYWKIQGFIKLIRKSS